MKYTKAGQSTFILRLEKGEEVVTSLQTFCKTHDIQSAYFTGLGSIENPTLAHYLVTTKKYTEKHVEGVFEVLSLIGNVALFNGEPLIHPHIVLSDEEMHAKGGHLVKAVVSATLEVHLIQLDTPLTKSMHDEIGLKLFDFPEELKQV